MNVKFVALSLTPSLKDTILLVITEKTGLAVAFGSTAEESLYDSFDCPMCGCQIIAKERKCKFIPYTPSDDKEDNNDEQI